MFYLRGRWSVGIGSFFVCHCRHKTAPAQLRPPSYYGKEAPPPPCKATRKSPHRFKAQCYPSVQQLETEYLRLEISPGWFLPPLPTVAVHLEFGQQQTPIWISLTSLHFSCHKQNASRTFRLSLCSALLRTPHFVSSASSAPAEAAEWPYYRRCSVETGDIWVNLVVVEFFFNTVTHETRSKAGKPSQNYVISKTKKP